MRLWVAAVVVALTIWPVSAASEPRLALVIGNGRYDATLGPLSNPVRDAEALRSALVQTGFQVVVASDLDLRQLRRTVSDFGVRISRAGEGATALFFYAGHGLQFRGTNYLVPVDAQIRSDGDIGMESISADSVLQQMEEAGAATRILILDACRNTPVLRAMRSGLRGFARMEAASGSFIAYSTAPGRTAADGASSNSPFVAALTREMVVPNRAIEEVFRDVRRSVVQGTGGEQVPWDASSLLAQFVFVRSGTAAAANISSPRPDIVAADRPSEIARPAADQSLGRSRPVERNGIEISVESVTDSERRYAVALQIRNVGVQDSAIAVEIQNSYRAQLFLSDGGGGNCQLRSNGEGWGSLRGYGPQNFDPSREMSRAGAPLPAGGTARHTLYFNKRRCDSLLTSRDGLSLSGTFYVAVDGAPQAFPVSFDGLAIGGETESRVIGGGPK